MKSSLKFWSLFRIFLMLCFIVLVPCLFFGSFIYENKIFPGPLPYIFEGKSTFGPLPCISEEENSKNGNVTAISVLEECPEDLLPRGWIAENVTVQKNFIYYNRVPKCGSSTMLSLIDILALRNDFVHGYENVTSIKSRTMDLQHLQLHSNNVVVFCKKHPALLYNRHLHFVDFRLYNHSQPVWINLIREPVEKYISNFYYKRMLWSQTHGNAMPSKGTSLYYWFTRTLDDCFDHLGINSCDLQLNTGRPSTYTMTPFFCGQSKECQILGSDWALAKAKENIEKWYLVVGILEDFNGTLAILEDKLPRFFRNATTLYNTYLREPYKKHKAAPHIDTNNTLNIRLKRDITFNRNENKKGLSEKNRELLRSKLSKEYDLYYFAKARLKNQISALRCRGQ